MQAQREIGTAASAACTSPGQVRDRDRVRAKLPAIKGSGCRPVPVICGPAFLTLDIDGHLMPDDHEASLRQVKAIFATALGSALDGPVTA